LASFCREYNSYLNGEYTEQTCSVKHEQHRSHHLWRFGSRGFSERR